MEHMWAPWRMAYIAGEEEKIDGCIFCAFPEKNDDERYLIVYRSQYCFVILNKFPYNNGHVMVVPYRHTHDLLALTPVEQQDCQQTLNKAIRALRTVYNPEGINMGMNMGRAAGAGIEEHIHYHLVPRWNGDTNFMPVVSGTKVISESLRQTWEKMRAAMEDAS
ncbi:MAG: HIT domain-containing protein [Calditrichaeota bacterium]|nr:MAG: HIT domain-containing protein [Calditrichota bacterium]